MLHKKATANPTQGKESKLNKRYIVDIRTKLIEIILFLFNFSLKKIKPKKNAYNRKNKIPKASINNSICCNRINPYSPITKN